MSNSVSINSVQISGGIAQISVHEGMAFANVAVSLPGKDGSGVFSIHPEYMPVKFFRKGLFPFLRKGTQLVVSGKLRQDMYERNGERISRMVIHAEDVTLVSVPDAKDAKPEDKAQMELPLE